MSDELTLSSDQRRALDQVKAWWQSTATKPGQFCDDEAHSPFPHTHGFAHDAPVMSIGGLAGTGKTTIARLLEDELKARIAFGTPTHKAAAVLRRKLEPEAADRVRTYHSMVYYPRVDRWCRRSGRSVQLVEHGCQALRDDGEECGCPERFGNCGGHPISACQVEERLSFTRREHLAGFRHLIVVDEASMLTEEQVLDIRSFGLPVLLIGDHGQLPPVKADMNPWMKAPIARLEVNHRQGPGSGITDLAHRVRGGYRPVIGTAGEGYAVLDRTAHGDHVQKLFGRFTPDPSRTVITWRNVTRVAVNRLMRGEDGQPRPGDRVVSLGNAELPVAKLKDGEWKPTHELPALVHNGELGTVVAVLGTTAKTIRLIVQLDGDRPAVGTWAALHQFNSPTSLTLNDPKRPSGRGWQAWDYGYAITAHKAQGSEFDDVIVVDERARDYERWMYTAVTRAKKKLVVVRW